MVNGDDGEVELLKSEIDLDDGHCNVIQRVLHNEKARPARLEARIERAEEENPMTTEMRATRHGELSVWSSQMCRT